MRIWLGFKNSPAGNIGHNIFIKIATKKIPNNEFQAMRPTSTAVFSKTSHIYIFTCGISVIIFANSIFQLQKNITKELLQSYEISFMLE